MPHKAATYSRICAKFFPFCFALISRIYAPQGYSHIAGCVSSSCASNSFAYWSPLTIVTSTHRTATIYALQTAPLPVPYSRFRDGLLFSRVSRVFTSLLPWTTSLHLSYFLRPLLLYLPSPPKTLPGSAVSSLHIITGSPYHQTELSSAYNDWNLRFLPVCVLRRSNAGPALNPRQGRLTPKLRRGGAFEQDQLRIFLSTCFWVISVYLVYASIFVWFWVFLLTGIRYPEDIKAQDTYLHRLHLNLHTSRDLSLKHHSILAKLIGTPVGNTWTRLWKQHLLILTLVVDLSRAW